ncbi:hypothetical protein WSK_4075 [Novosphingobium sp. Rr 2-17]|uniref:hypothetical protein n=1 Tax=Novosphingobium sp. Rr 2-17 TaxID=555793 RepID=UPI0002699F36|nr:hypothetical protein [Novosphingobium sp. Rr 2-17]EIZ77343.1 hypothetical protein WSK_4075 [Novosphingobium sp. Rr 2-17]
MRKFTKFIAPALIAAIGLGGVAGSASAQPGPRDQVGRQMERQMDRRDTVRADIDGLRNKIDRAEARRTISKREATGLRREVAQIQQTHARYARNGLTAGETRDLQKRVDRVQMALQGERHDRDGRRG